MASGILGAVQGLYWDSRYGGRWYVLEPDASGIRHRHNVARPEAKLSDLHAVMEQRRGVDRTTLAWLLDQFHASTEFAALKKRTRDGYAATANTSKNIPTKVGALGTLAPARMSPSFMQGIVEKIAQGGHPTKANHVLRYLRRVFAWGIRFGHCNANPCKGVRQARERKNRAIPEVEVMEKFIAYARVRGARKAHTKGSAAPYLWIVAELAYLMRLRGIEVLDLTDASETAEGVVVSRRKGSRGNVTRWSPRLRTAWDAAQAYRREAIPAERPVPLQPAQRHLIVGQDGHPLSKSGLDTAWQRLQRDAMKEKVISERFGLHAMKHRGITDTAGNRADKREASGHKSDAMMDVYDHSLPIVDPAGKG